LQPSEKTVAAAASGWGGEGGGFDQPTNSSAKDAWPITGATFILIYKNAEKPQQTAEVMKFFDWAYKNGDQMALELDYVPMPDSVVKQVQSSWSVVKDGSGKVIWQGR